MYENENKNAMVVDNYTSYNPAISLDIEDDVDTYDIIVDILEDDFVNHTIDATFDVDDFIDDFNDEVIDDIP